MKSPWAMAITLLLAGCATTSGGLFGPDRYTGMSLEQALVGANLNNCKGLSKDYGYGPVPATPPDYWRDTSALACDENSRIGFVQTPEGRRLVVPVVPKAIPGQCWLKRVENFQGNTLVMHLGTAWLDPTRNSSRNDTRGKLFDCDNIPWEGGKSMPLTNPT